MAHLISPIRDPLTCYSKRTLLEAFSIAQDYDADITVLHVNIYQKGRGITQNDLQDAVEAEFGHLDNTQYVVRTGFLLEETITDEIIGENADIVVMGKSHPSHWRRIFCRIFPPVDIETALNERLDCPVVAVDG